MGLVHHHHPPSDLVAEHVGEGLGLLPRGPVLVLVDLMQTNRLLCAHRLKKVRSCDIPPTLVSDLPARIRKWSRPRGTA
jgi:hypothetical protein